MHSSVERVERLNGDTSIIRFTWNEAVKPGQFIMVWIPEVGEIPISVSHVGNPKGITIKAYGPTSRALVDIREGDRIFFRGPYGRPFFLVPGRRLIIGAGTGMASLLPVIDSKTFGIIAARSKKELLFADAFDEQRRLLVTDDGSAGIKGIAVDALTHVDLNQFDMVYVCGPEMMMKSVYDFLRPRGTSAQFSLERLMKCGIGLCDSCSIGGLQLCRDGPTFDIKELDTMEEFGRSRVLESGKRISMGK
ncbi:dihydroorotate dehydrogenase electron transfer subunit [Thermoplasmatales archaeon AK]|nr:dihydroorotate dehydrogenase electron transfer subunit [Thermoplasmatales archaeon AK]